MYRWNWMVPLSQHHRRVLLCHPANSAAWLYLVPWDAWYLMIPDTFYSVMSCNFTQSDADCVCMSYPLCLCLFDMRMFLRDDRWLRGLVWDSLPQWMLRCVRHNEGDLTSKGFLFLWSCTSWNLSGTCRMDGCHLGSSSIATEKSAILFVDEGLHLHVG